MVLHLTFIHACPYSYLVPPPSYTSVPSLDHHDPMIEQHKGVTQRCVNRSSYSDLRSVPYIYLMSLTSIFVFVEQWNFRYIYGFITLHHGVPIAYNSLHFASIFVFVRAFNCFKHLRLSMRLSAFCWIHSFCTIRFDLRICTGM